MANKVIPFPLEKPAPILTRRWRAVVNVHGTLYSLDVTASYSLVPSAPAGRAMGKPPRAADAEPGWNRRHACWQTTYPEPPPAAVADMVWVVRHWREINRIAILLNSSATKLAWPVARKRRDVFVPGSAACLRVGCRDPVGRATKFAGQSCSD